MNVAKSLIKARIQLLLDKCFYGNLALHLKLVENNDIPTMATDGKVILYNKEFTKALSNQDKMWILAHEILHNVFYHLTRRKGREPKLWNVAIDFAVNCVLYKEFGYMPNGVLYDRRFENMSAEKIYRILNEEQDGKSGGEGEDGEESDGDSNGNGSGDLEFDKNGNVKKYNGKRVKRIDEHKDIKKGKSKEQIEDLEKEWKLQATKSYQQSKMIGKTPLGMEIFIQELLEPKVDWRTILKQFVVSSAKSDYRWLPPNKRFIHKGLYLPSLTGDSLGDVAIFVDVSGSTYYYLKRFFSECNALLQEYDMNLHLITFDTEIKSYKIYTKGEEIDTNYKGLGGTDVRVAFDRLREENIFPSVVVCLTDGYTPFPEGEEYPTLWVVPDRELQDSDFPFGQVTRILDEEEEDN